MVLVAQRSVALQNHGGVQDMVVVIMVRPVKDWDFRKIHVMAVAPLDGIAAIVAALKAKSAVVKYVVHKTIIALIAILAAHTRVPLVLQIHRRRHRRHQALVAVVIYLREDLRVVTNAVMVACNAAALIPQLGNQFVKRDATVDVGNNAHRSLRETMPDTIFNHLLIKAFSSDNT